MRLHNTLTGTTDEFSPVHRTWYGKPKVSMYHCGPTVYHYAHIGNMRTYLFADTLKRAMKAHGYVVRQVINITDVGHLVSDGDEGEDKLEKAKRREGKSAWDIARFYTDAFFTDLERLNIDTNGTRFPRATDYIKQQIALIRKLEQKGYTYRTSDGIYFDTAQFPKYGALGNIDLSGIREGERIGIHEEKRNPTDFALWKFSPADAKRDMEWPSPWGVGFPGWHIECSAMAMDLLGETVDIHTGGIDHIPVHHNNEIAQSEGATGHTFARFWMHAAFLTVKDGKMSKSAGDFLTLSSLVEAGYSVLDYRYFLLGAHYSTPMDFSWDALAAAKNARERLVKTIRSLPKGGRCDKTVWGKALAYASDDLDTPKILALQWETLKDTSLSPANKRATVLAVDSLLGLFKSDEELETANETIPAAVEALLHARGAARAAKDWKKSDDLRTEIGTLGYEVSDHAEGQRIVKK